ncbi:MAG: hypothetical protein V4525_08180 [Pseudomonadota bacterium]
MLLNSKKASLLISSFIPYFLIGCGGGGSNTSNTTVTPEVPNVTSPAGISGLQTPALLITPDKTQLVYGKLTQTIPQDSYLYKANSLNYDVGDINGYVKGTFSSIQPLHSANNDTVQTKILNINLDGIAYLNNNQIMYMDSKTFASKTLSTSLNLSENGSFCGFFDSIYNEKNNNHYFVYATAASCANTNYQNINFYITSSSDNSTIVPKKIFNPIASLNDGWLVWKTNSDNSLYVDIIRCNYDCSTMQTIGKIYPPAPVYTFKTINSSHVKNDHILFAIGSQIGSPPQAFFVFNANTNTITPIFNNFEIDPDSGVPSQKSIIPELIPGQYLVDMSYSNTIAEDDQNFYFAVRGNTTCDAKLVMLNKQNPKNYKLSTFSNFGNKNIAEGGLDCGGQLKNIYVTKNKIFLHLNNGARELEYLVSVDKNTTSGSFISNFLDVGYTHITPMYFQIIEADWDNDKLLTTGTLGVGQDLITSIFDSLGNENRSQNNTTYLSILLPSSTESNYFIRSELLQISSLLGSSKIDFNSVKTYSPYTKVSLGSVTIEGNYQLYPMLTTGNVGGFAVVEDNKTKLFSFDSTQANSLQCFSGC